MGAGSPHREGGVGGQGPGGGAGRGSGVGEVQKGGGGKAEGGASCVLSPVVLGQHLPGALESESRAGTGQLGFPGWGLCPELWPGFLITLLWAQGPERDCLTCQVTGSARATPQVYWAP